MNPKPVLILTDPLVRKTFDVYNYLAATAPGYDFALVHGERSAKINKLYPKITFWEPQLEQLLTKHPDRTFVYIPFEEEPTLAVVNDALLQRHGNLRALLPSAQNFTTARDKLRLARFCGQQQLPAPRHYQLHEVRDENFVFQPLIVKPAVGSGAIGHIHVDEPADLEKLRPLEASDDLVIQQKLPHSKDVEGGFFLMQKGELVAYYGHQRIRTYPERGGVTVYSHYAENPAVKAAGTEILQALNWSGLAMLEFLRNEENDRYELIEINPRLWGSVLLSEFSGAGLVEKYIQLSLGQPVSSALVKQDSAIRWLIPYDIMYALKGGIFKRDFWTNDRADVCYINMSYASVYRSALWHLYSIFDAEKLKKLYQKIKS